MSVVIPARESDAALSALDDALARLRRRDIPYPYAAAEDIFDDTLATELAELFASDMRWEPIEERYCHCSVSSNAVECLSSSPAAWLIAPRAQEIMRKHLKRTFAGPVTSTVQVAAHRLEKGDWIGTHNNSQPSAGGRAGPGVWWSEGRRSYRLVFMFSSTDASVRGGELVLIRYRGHMRDEIVVGSRNGAVAMQFSSQSFHRVSRVYEGVHYSLICTFSTRDAMEDRRGSEQDETRKPGARRIADGAQQSIEQER